MAQSNPVLREKEIFETLKLLKQRSFVLIGGYAVNAYVKPRFSIDCDIVINDMKGLEDLEKVFLNVGYFNQITSHDDSVGYSRYVKTLPETTYKVSFDVLAENVMDRRSKARFSAKWIFENSDVRRIKGITITEELSLKVINVDALFVMKMISSRETDIRDIFMLAPLLKDREWVKKEVSLRYDFKKLFDKVRAKITSKQFKDSLQGVYGLVDNKVFDRSMSAILGLEELE